MIFWIFISGNSARAQIISGQISDVQNAPIAGAEISLINQTKTISETTTDGEGRFSIDLKGTQNSLLLVKAKGFASFSKILPKDFNEFLNIALSPAAVREDVTISIARTESGLNETPASVVVLNRETIEQTAAQSVDDMLRQVAGFTLFRRASSKTSNPTTQGANLRGISGSGASRTTVLFDGVSLNDAFGGWTYWSRVPRAAIETAEILRGGASAFYGTSALSGAINLETKKSDKPVFSFETSGGTQETYDGSLFAAFGKNGWNIAVAAESFKTEGYIPVDEMERGAVDTNANSLHHSGFLTLEKSFGKDKSQKSLNAKFFENGRIFWRGSLFAERRDNGTFLTYNRTYFRQGIFGVDLNGERIGVLQTRFSIESQVYDQTFSAVGADRNSENLTRIQRVPSQAKYLNLFWARGFGSHAVSAFIEAREVRGFSDETGIGNNRATALTSSGGRERLFGVFAQDFWRVTKKFNLSFGGRFDRWRELNARSITQNLTGNQIRTTQIFPDRTQREFSPRIAAIYQINDNFAVLGSYAKSFRAPTLNELYRGFRVGSIVTLANENLVAERAETFEAGINFTSFSKRLSVRGNAFVTEVLNPIVSITLNTTPTLITRRRENVGETRTKGLELDADFAVKSNLRLSVGYLLVDSRVSKFAADASLVGNFLPQIPRQQLTLQMFYRPQKRWSVSLQGRISGGQFENDQNTLRLRPFFALDAFASYRLKKYLEIFAAAENVFNNRYDIGLTPIRTVAAPIFVRAGLRFHLR